MTRVSIEVPVQIPTADGNSIAETLMVKVEALYDPTSGETFLDGTATEYLDKVKARHMGILLPKEIKELRLQFGLSQREISELLGVGEKTYTRWESGRERPSQSLNKLLMALAEGRLNFGDLLSLQEPSFNWFSAVPTDDDCGSKQISTTLIPSKPTESDHESFSSAA